jgi:CBS domain-containing protein
MASNERWCKPWSSWKEYFREWIMTPMPPEIYLSTIFFDFRCVAGRGRLTEELMDYVQAKARRYPLFLKYFARYFLLNEPPLSFYDDSVVEKDGARIPVLDLKTRSLLPFVDFARIMALLHGIRETNTLARFRDLCDRGHIPRNLYLEARQAYEYALHLMLVHQLRKHEAGEEPDNVVRPSDLSNLERKTIKFSFSVVERLMDFVREELRVNARTKLPIVAKPMRGGSQ